MYTEVVAVKRLKHPPRNYSVQYARNEVVYLVAGFARYQEAMESVREKVGGRAVVYWTVSKKAPLIHNGKKRRKK